MNSVSLVVGPNAKPILRKSSLVNLRKSEPAIFSLRRILISSLSSFKFFLPKYSISSSVLKSLTTSDIVLVEISSVIEAGEAGEEACEDMVFICVCLCLRKKYANKKKKKKKKKTILKKKKKKYKE